MAGGSEDSFIQPLGLLLGLTAVLALILSYAGQSTIIAFILVGVIVNALGAEPDPTTLGHISEVGILILLFMAGLEVDLGAFIKNWMTAATIGVGQIACSTAIFGAASLLVLPAVGMDATRDAAVYFGLCMCFSSTILVLGYLKGSRSMRTLHGQLCLGTLVLQDAASVLGIAVLGGIGKMRGTCEQTDPVDCSSAGYDATACEALGPGCAMTYAGAGPGRRFLGEASGSGAESCVDSCSGYSESTCSALDPRCTFEEPEPEGGGGIAVSVFVLFGKLLAAMLIFFLLERFILRRMFEAFARSLELLYLGSLGYATGLAALAVTAGFSGEITAFLAGVSISRLPYKMHIETKMEPIKTLGVAIFFISLGLGIELGRETAESLPIGFGLAFFKLLATLPLFVSLGLLARLKSHTVFMLGVLMNQISEFSLILCTLCVRAKVFEPVVLTVMTVAAVVSIVISSIGHTYIDAIYTKVQRLPCLRCIDDHRHREIVKNQSTETASSGELEQTVKEPDVTKQALEEPIDLKRGPSLQRHRPPGLGANEDWSFEDQLTNRLTEHLEIDLEETERELEEARESMAATADEKRLNLHKSKKRLYVPSPKSVIRTSHAPDIMHGMIEGYMVVDQQLVFCTLRAGRMLFWGNQNDVGQAPPASVWDISGMAILENGRGGGKGSGSGKDLKRSEDSIHSSDDEDEVCPWEWTIVLGHIHRRTGTLFVEDDSIKLSIHGLEDDSNHDAQDWYDALTVATSILNPIALRLSHIREELNERRNTENIPSWRGSGFGTVSRRNRNEIICIGYNEMFPAVLSLADTIGKEVVVVEYDPMKLNTIEKLYNEEKRRQDHRERMGRKSSLASLGEGAASIMERSHSSDDLERSAGRPRPRRVRAASTPMPPRGSVRQGFWASDSGSGKSSGVEVELKTPPRPRRVRQNSMPLPQSSLGNRAFWVSQSASDGSNSGEDNIRGVSGRYADIHDPECWEELEMDHAFMLICTVRGARHAERAMLNWLHKRDSDAIFVTCASNNIEAMSMYKAGAKFVMQTDALTMRSARDILLETVANVGDCSQLVAAGLAHGKRLARLEEEDKLRYQYEC